MSDLPMGWLETPAFRLSREDMDDLKPRPCRDCGATADESACAECGECESCRCVCVPVIPSQLERAA